MYKFYGTIGRPVAATLLGNLTPIVYNELDDALGAALNLDARGGTPVLIESETGIRLSRDEILKMVKERREHLNGRPKIH
jgi:hypothetical protein